MANLLNLWLYNNKLTSIQQGTFAGLTNLKKPPLSNNQLNTQDMKRNETKITTIKEIYNPALTLATSPISFFTIRRLSIISIKK